MKVLALLSGGKDSVAAVHLARTTGWDVVGACTLEVVGADSHMFHRPNARWAPLVAEAMGLDVFTRKTEGEEEKELDDLEALLVEAKEATGADGVVSGALASEYQRTRIERIGDRIGLKTFTPLWHKEAETYMRSLIDGRFHVRFVAVAAEGLGRGWLGRELTPRAYAHLKHQAARYRLHITGEGGEYETLVTDGPGFRRPIEVGGHETHWHRDSGWWEIKDATLGPEQDRPAPLHDE